MWERYRDGVLECVVSFRTAETVALGGFLSQQHA
jgi:hypothetical protein